MTDHHEAGAAGNLGGADDGRGRNRARHCAVEGRSSVKTAQSWVPVYTDRMTEAHEYSVSAGIELPARTATHRGRRVQVSEDRACSSLYIPVKSDGCFVSGFPFPFPFPFPPPSAGKVCRYAYPWDIHHTLNEKGDCTRRATPLMGVLRGFRWDSGTDSMDAGRLTVDIGGAKDNTC